MNEPLQNQNTNSLLKYCPACGHAVSVMADKCTNCGHPVRKPGGMGMVILRWLHLGVAITILLCSMLLPKEPDYTLAIGGAVGSIVSYLWHIGIISAIRGE